MGWFDLAAGPCGNGMAAIIAVLAGSAAGGDELYFIKSTNSDVAGIIDSINSFCLIGSLSSLFNHQSVQLMVE